MKTLKELISGHKMTNSIFTILRVIWTFLENPNVLFTHSLMLVIRHNFRKKYWRDLETSSKIVIVQKCPIYPILGIIRIFLNPLSTNITKWLNTLKQFVGKLPTNCLSVFDHFVGLALKGLIIKAVSFIQSLMPVIKSSFRKI